MFKIGTKGDYGLLLLSALAQEMKKGHSCVSLKKIALTKHLSLSYLSQIIMPLKEAGLVISKEGKGGGYALSRKPSKITMMEVLETLEGPITPVKCCSLKRIKCGSEPYCNIKQTWRAAQSTLIEFLCKRTLEDIN